MAKEARIKPKPQKAILFDLKDKKKKREVILEKSQDIRDSAPPEVPMVTQEEKDRVISQVDEIIEKKARPLFAMKAVFPFDFFPNEVSIDMKQINFVIKEFFFTSRLHSISIGNVMDVFVDMGPFFASLHIVDMSFVENKMVIPYLKRKDAVRARRIIQGLIAINAERVDIGALNHDELLRKLEELGRAKEVSL